MNSPFTRRALLASALSLVPLSAWAQQTPPANPAAPTPTTPAQDTKPAPKIDADAKKLVQQMVAAQQALNSFSASVASSAPVQDKIQNVTSTILYAKPNKAIVTSQSTETGAKSRIVLDGKYVYGDSSTDPKTYNRRESGSDPQILAAAISGAGASFTGLLPLIIADPLASEKVIPPSSETLEFLPDENLDGVPVRVVKSSISTPASVVFTLAIGKTDNLLRRVVISITQNGKTNTITDVYTNVQANPPVTDKTFVYTPVAGATLKELPKAAAAKAPSEDGPAFDPRLKVGAVPLPFKGTDTKGQPVSLAAYKGKVVLVDFWATWCPPCREEVPNVVAAYKKYHAQGFEVVGVSLDQPDDGTKLASFTKSNQMTWRQVHDKTSSIANGYAVKFIPFAMLIGRDGKIAAVNVRGAELDKAIAVALKK